MIAPPQLALGVALAAAFAAEPSDAAAVDDSPQAGPCTDSSLSTPGSYRVGSGDVVQVQVYGEPDLSGAVPVDQGGSLLIPLVGTVKVGGLTADCIAERITAALADGYINDPDVTVALDGYRSQPVSVLGAVKNPGLYYLDGTTSVLQMLSKAGGVATDGVDAVRLTRAGAEDAVVVIPYEALVSEGRDNVQLNAGDVLFVPDLSVSVQGSVRKPGDVPYREGLTVSRCIAAAGGATEVANIGRVYLLRGEQRIRVNVRRILAGKEADITLQPGDQVFVKESIF